MTKRPIDRLRDAAVSMTIGDDQDQSAVAEVIPMGHRLLIVKGNSLWQTQLADAIDPERTNASIPNVNQKLLARGTSDPLLAKTLLQAKRLLDSSILPSTIPTEKGLELTLEILTELSALEEKSQDLSRAIKASDERYEGARKQDNSLQLPAVGDVAARGKAYIQGADHVAQALWAFSRVFYSDLPTALRWEEFRRRFAEGTEYGKSLATNLDEIIPSVQFIRRARNAVEHPKPNQKVILNDYKLHSDGTLYRPSIEIVEPQFPLPQMDLGLFFSGTFNFLVHLYQFLLVHLCAAAVDQDTEFAVEVVELAENQRRYPEVKFAYASFVGDQLVPFAG